MSGFKGTKGKWNYEIVRNSTCKIHVVDNSFAEVYLPFNADDIKEMESNALLISKAPEMLEMLEKIEHDLRHGYNIQSWVQIKIQQLIKSATEL